MFIPGGCFCCEPPEDPCTLSGCTWSSTDMSRVNSSGGLGSISGTTYYRNPVSGATPDGSYTIVNEQSSDIGNDAPSRKLSITTVEAPQKPDTIYVSCFSNTMRHNPTSQCALPDASFCVESKVGPESDSDLSASVVFLIRQDNNIYSTTTFSLGDNWARASGTFVSSDFVNIAGGGGTPNFTNTGSLIEFGFALKLTVGADESPYCEAYFDNLCVSIISCQGCLSGCHVLAQDNFSPSIQETSVSPVANQSDVDVTTGLVQSTYYGTSIKTECDYGDGVVATTTWSLVKTGVMDSIEVECKLPYVSLCLDAMSTSGNTVTVYPAIVQNGTFYANGGSNAGLNRWQSITSASFYEVSFSASGVMQLNSSSTPDFEAAFEVGVIFKFTADSTVLIDNVCVKYTFPNDCTFTTGSGSATGDCTVVDGSGMSLADSGAVGTTEVSFEVSSTIGLPAPSGLVKFCKMKTPSSANYGVATILFDCEVTPECMKTHLVSGRVNIACCAVGASTTGLTAGLWWAISQAGKYFTIGSYGIANGGWTSTTFSVSNQVCSTTWYEIDPSTGVRTLSVDAPDFDQAFKIAAVISTRSCSNNFCHVYLDNFAITKVERCCGRVHASCDPVQYSVNLTGFAFDALIPNKCGQNYIEPLRAKLEELMNSTFVVSMTSGASQAWGSTSPTTEGCGGSVTASDTYSYVVSVAGKNVNVTSNVSVRVSLHVNDCESWSWPQHLTSLGPVYLLLSIEADGIGSDTTRCLCSNAFQNQQRLGPRDFYYSLDPGCSSSDDSCCIQSGSLEWWEDDDITPPEECTARFYSHPNLVWNWAAVTADINKL